jgi:hypothetical protein
VVIWLMHSITWLPYITLYLLSRITSYTWNGCLWKLLAVSKCIW